MKIVGRNRLEEVKTPFLESDELRREPLSGVTPKLRQNPQSEARARLTRAMRMNTFEVTNVLKFGKRSRAKKTMQSGENNESDAKPATLKPVVEARTIARNTGIVSAVSVKTRIPSHQIGVRLAAAVPKRLLKRSVDRNLVKRWIRESVRQHACRFATMDLLVTLTAKFNPKSPEDRTRVKRELSLLLTEALLVSRKPVNPQTPRGTS